MNKYIKTEDGKFVLFSKVAVHRHVARLRLRSPTVSAGFVHSLSGQLHCIGRSESLNLDSLPEDTEQLRVWLGL